MNPTPTPEESIGQRLASLRDEIAVIEEAIKAHSDARDQLARLQSEIHVLSRRVTAATSERPPLSAIAPAVGQATDHAAPERRQGPAPFLVALLTLVGVWLLVGLHIALLLTLHPALQPQPALGTASAVAPGPSPIVAQPTPTSAPPTLSPATPIVAPAARPTGRDQGDPNATPNDALLRGEVLGAQTRAQDDHSAVTDEEELEPEAPIAVAELEPAIGAALIRPPRGFAAAHLRKQPSTSARIIRTLSTGSRVDLVHGSARAGFLWLRVRTDDGQVGWVVSTALQRVGR